MNEKNKMYLSEKLLHLLDSRQRTQVELAKFAGITQGLVADHIRKKTYPKIETLNIVQTYP